MKKENSPSGPTAMIFLFVLINNVRHLWIPVTLQMAVMLTRALPHVCCPWFWTWTSRELAVNGDENRHRGGWDSWKLPPSLQYANDWLVMQSNFPRLDISVPTNGSLFIKSLKKWAPPPVYPKKLASVSSHCHKHPITATSILRVTLIFRNRLRKSPK